MKTLYKGIYAGCPIDLAPTGYLLWCLENDFMESLLTDIYAELKQRKLSIDESFTVMPQPMSIDSWLTYDWFADWTDEVRKKYMSMVENDSKFLSPEHKRFATYYNNILAKLTVFAKTNNIVETPLVTEYQQHYNNFYEQLFERK